MMSGQEPYTDSELVLRAIRLAEKAHRTRSRGPHFRKAPRGEDRPSYLVHLAEVAWMLCAAGASRELVAAAYLHDVIEDCDYTAEMLEAELGSRQVRLLVESVTEIGRDPRRQGGKVSWEQRNADYLERMRRASPEVLNLSCADKSANLMDMCRFLALGYRSEDFTSREHAVQLAKYQALDQAYRGNVVPALYDRFALWLKRFAELHP